MKTFPKKLLPPGIARSLLLMVMAMAIGLMFGPSRVLADNALNSVLGETPFYDPDETGPTGPSGTSGSGNSCLAITGIQVNNQAALANSLSAYISKLTAGQEPPSPFNGLTMAQDIIAGSIADNVNPFLVVAIGWHEGELGVPSAIPTDSYNTFGREAGPGQPSAPAPTAAPPHTVVNWYKWDSWVDSIDSSTDEQSLIEGTYINDGITDLADFADKYAPPSQNDTAAYISYLTTDIDTMISDAGSSITCTSSSGSSAPISSQPCTGTVSASTPALKVVEIAEQQYNCWQAGTITSAADSAPNVYGYTYGEEWCGIFAGWVYEQAGLNFAAGRDAVAWVPNASNPSETGPSYTYHAVRDDSWVYDGAQYSDLNFYENGEHFDLSSDYDPSYTPQPGDLAIHTWASSSWPDNIPMDHVNIVISVSGSGQNSTVTEIGGDQNPPGQGWSATTSVVDTEGPEVESGSGPGQANIVGYLSPTE